MTRTIPGRTDHVVVVGAGLSGLSAALHLLGAGRRVTVVERDPLPGGRAGRLVRGGYRFDTGPTVLTMPDLADEAFAAVGDSLYERVDLIPLHPAYRARFADGSSIDVHTGAEAMEAEVRRFAGAGEAADTGGCATGSSGCTGPRCATSSTPTSTPLAAADARPGPARGTARLRPAGHGHRAPPQGRAPAPRVLLPGPVRGRAAGRALAAYAVIAYMDTVAGVYFPRGGMHAVPQAMADAAADAGAELRFGQDVTRLERSGDRVTAVVTTEDRIPCDAVVLTPDLPVAYRLLGRAPRRPLRIRHSPSAVVLHAGTDRTWPELAHHTLSFGAAWRGTFDELTRTGELMSDPSLLITRPTATDPGLAPPGHHLHYILAPCPNSDIGPDAAEWSDLAPRYRDSVLKELEQRGLDGIGSAIEEQCLVTPADWQARGHAAARPSRRPTPSPRPARSARATWSGAPRTRCSPAAAPHRVWAYRPFCCRASSPRPGSPDARSARPAQRSGRGPPRKERPHDRPRARRGGHHGPGAA